MNQDFCSLKHRSAQFEHSKPSTDAAPTACDPVRVIGAAGPDYFTCHCGTKIEPAEPGRGYL